jgi:trimethylamine:corrinoid methyltransferase-like protein
VCDDADLQQSCAQRPGAVTTHNDNPEATTDQIGTMVVFVHMGGAPALFAYEKALGL